MRKNSFQKVFQGRCQEAVRLLSCIPLTDVNRHAMETAARKASVDALLAANFSLVHACHDVSVLASTASGPEIPEGRARLGALRAALLHAGRVAGLASAAEGRDDGSEGRGFPGCVFAEVFPVRGRLPVPSAILDRAKALGIGLRLLRFQPSDLRKTPRDLSEKLADLTIRGVVLGLYAVTGLPEGSAAREFALFVPDHADPDAVDPLAGLPVTGLIRTILAAGENSVPDLGGLELVEAVEERAADVQPARKAIPCVPEPRVEAPGSGVVRTGKPEGPFAVRPEAGADVRAADAGTVLSGAYRNSTVLHVDILSFLQTARGMAPDSAAEYLNRLLARLSSCVETSGGVVDAFVGSSLYAFWGAPTASGRDAAFAAEAALAMRAFLRSLNRNRAESGKPPLRMACGLDSSPVLAGRIGAPNRLSYTVAGEASKQAGRIGSLNERLGTDILVSDYTLRLMGEGFLTYPIRGARTDGAAEALPVHALIGRRRDSACPKDLAALRAMLAAGA